MPTGTSPMLVGMTYVSISRPCGVRVAANVLRARYCVLREKCSGMPP